MQAPENTPTSPSQPMADAHLEMMVRVVEAQSGASAALSLTTVGGIVSGSLVSSAVWAARWREVVQESIGAEDHAEQLIQLPAIVQDALPEQDGPSLHHFVHLVDVTFLSAPGAPTTPLWRGRISDISGWSLGAPV
ncbi:hypothetical protein ACIPPS_07110 [Streptomyces sp. NPDC090127]|uniref:hypothetical protein n=1 Tax=Streptomyces sp. NPDC090127 TaxID=3365953 RepID=UPI0038107909